MQRKTIIELLTFKNIGKMKAQKQINVYYFNELSEEVQNKVHEENRYFLTETRTCNFDELTEEFKSFIKSVGGYFTFDFVGYDTLLNRVFTRWQCSIESFLDALGTKEAQQKHEYLKNCEIPEFKIDTNLLDLIQEDFDYSTFVVEDNHIKLNIEAGSLKKEIRELKGWLEDVVQVIYEAFLKNIEGEQDYLESKEAFAEYCEINEKLFTAEGIQIN